jgi:hypothetical protein
MLIKLEYEIYSGSKIPGFIREFMDKYNKESEIYRVNLESYITTAIQPEHTQIYRNYKNLLINRIDKTINQTRKEFGSKYGRDVNENTFRNIQMSLLNLRDGILQIEWDDIVPFFNTTAIISTWYNMVGVMINMMIWGILENLLGFPLRLDKENMNSWYNKFMEIRVSILQRITKFGNIRLPRIAIQTLMTNIIVFWNIRDFVVPNVNLLDSAKKISDRFS